MGFTCPFCRSKHFTHSVRFSHHLGAKHRSQLLGSNCPLPGCSHSFVKDEPLHSRSSHVLSHFTHRSQNSSRSIRSGSPPPLPHAVSFDSFAPAAADDTDSLPHFEPPSASPSPQISPSPSSSSFSSPFHTLVSQLTPEAKWWLQAYCSALKHHYTQDAFVEQISLFQSHPNISPGILGETFTMAQLERKFSALFESLFRIINIMPDDVSHLFKPTEAQLSFISLKNIISYWNLHPVVSRAIADCCSISSIQRTISEANQDADRFDFFTGEIYQQDFNQITLTIPPNQRSSSYYLSLDFWNDGGLNRKMRKNGCELTAVTFRELPFYLRVSSFSPGVMICSLASKSVIKVLGMDMIIRAIRNIDGLELFKRGVSVYNTHLNKNIQIFAVLSSFIVDVPARNNLLNAKHFSVLSHVGCSGCGCPTDELSSPIYRPLHTIQAYDSLLEDQPQNSYQRLSLTQEILAKERGFYCHCELRDVPLSDPIRFANFFFVGYMFLICGFYIRKVRFDPHHCLALGVELVHLQLFTSWLATHLHMSSSKFWKTVTSSSSILNWPDTARLSSRSFTSFDDFESTLSGAQKHCFFIAFPLIVATFAPQTVFATLEWRFFISHVDACSTVYRFFPSHDDVERMGRPLRFTSL